MAEQRVAVRLSADTASYLTGIGRSEQATDKLQRAVANLDRQLRSLDRRDINIQAKLDASRVRAELARFEQGRYITVSARLDLTSARNELRAFETGRTVNIAARVSATFAPGTEASLQRELDRMRLTVRVRPQLGPLPTPSLSGGSGGGGGIGLGGGLLGAAAGLVAVLPQAVSLLSSAAAGATALAGQLGVAAAAGAGLVPILGAAAQAAAGIKLGSLGVITAFKGATADAAAPAATSASSSAAAIRSAADSIISARQGVARAQEAASRGVESALRRQEGAERSLADAQADARRAQLALSQAREDAQDDLEDLTSRVANGVLAERDAVLDLAEARADLANAPSDARAILNVDQATQALADQRIENGRLAEAQAYAQRTGIEGTARVLSAQADVSQSVRDEGDARRDVALAAQETARARVDGARSVQDAQRALTQAQAAYGEAVARSSEKAAGGISKLDTALAKLGPNQRAFVAEGLRTKAVLDRLRNDVGEALFADLDDSLRTVTTDLLPVFRTELVDTGSIVNRLGRGLVTQLAGPLRDDVAGSLRLNNDLLLKASPLVGRLLSIALALYQAAGPLAGRILDSANSMAKLGDESAQAGLASGRLGGFFDRAGDRAGNLLRTAGNLGSGLRDVFAIGNQGSTGLLPSLEAISARFEAFTGSVRGETAIRAWFADGRAAGTELRGLLGDISREFGGLTANVSAADVVGGLRDAVPFVAQLVRALSDGGDTGRAFGQAVLDIANTLDRLNAGLGISGFLGTLFGLIGGLTDLVEASGPVAPALGVVVAALGSLAAVNLVTGGFLRLAPALAALITPAGLVGLAVGGVGLALFKAREDARKTEQAFRDLADLPPVDLLDQGKVEASRAELERSVQALADFKLGLQGAMDVDTATLRRLEREAAQAQTQLDLLNGRFDAVSSTVPRLAQELGLTNEELVDLADKANVDLRTATYDEASRAISSYRLETGGAAQASQALERDLKTMGDASSTAGEKADALRRIMNGLDGGILDANEAAIAFQESLDRMAESAGANGKSLDINTAAGRANQSAIIDAKRALDERIASDVAAGVSGEDLRQRIERGSAQLRDQIIATYGTTDAARALINQYNLTPEQIATNFTTPGLDDALKKVYDLNAAVKNLLTVPGMTVSVATSLARQEQAQARRAYGGPVPGSSPHKRADNVPLLATAGEWVHQVDAVNYYGDDVMAALNERRIPRELFQRRAQGGRVDAGTLAFTIDPEAFGSVYGGAVTALQQAAARMEPSQGGSSTGLIPIMAAARQYVMDTYGVRNIGGFSKRNIAGTSKPSDHSFGKAIDIMTTNLALGNAIAADFAFGNAGRQFKAENVIWQQAISSNGRPFRGMADRGSPTQNHRDHVHVDTFDLGGRATGIGYMPKATLAPERVLSPVQTQAFDQLVQRLDAPDFASWVRQAPGGGQGSSPAALDRMVAAFERGEIGRKDVGGIHLHGTQTTPAEVVAALNWELR